MEQTDGQTVQLLMIWGAIAPKRCPSNIDSVRYWEIIDFHEIVFLLLLSFQWGGTMKITNTYLYLIISDEWNPNY